MKEKVIDRRGFLKMGVKAGGSVLALSAIPIHLLAQEKRIEIVHLIIRHAVTPEPIRMFADLLSTIHLEEFRALRHKWLEMIEPSLVASSQHRLLYPRVTAALIDERRAAVTGSTAGSANQNRVAVDRGR